MLPFLKICLVIFDLVGETVIKCLGTVLVHQTFESLNKSNAWAEIQRSGTRPETLHNSK